jgi:hypothetical protein
VFLHFSAHARIYVEQKKRAALSDGTLNFHESLNL